ncbi:sigma-70 region 4 domain-containing protein [Streptomyces carpaticus]|uniref:sigma factor-like helix-turn-helix DNA-binding protein n=1 Tax=Streptomyces carpaticus TaxID=285558 RepID=UPI0021FD70C0|nr:sigma-70 region 4 domain-containing protein [Streptomyces carpaticus]
MPPLEQALRLPVRRTSVSLHMPADFTAFCLLHHDRYLQYGRVRLSTVAAAEVAVETALGDLAVRWPSTLGSPRPVAVAWQILGNRMASAPLSGDDDIFHRTLPSVQADVLVLRRCLALTASQIADLMGIDEPRIKHHLVLAEHNITKELMDRMPVSSPDPVQQDKPVNAIAENVITGHRSAPIRRFQTARVPQNE